MLGKGGSGSGLRSGGIFCFGPATNFPFSMTRVEYGGGGIQWKGLCLVWKTTEGWKLSNFALGAASIHT